MPSKRRRFLLILVYQDVAASSSKTMIRRRPHSRAFEAPDPGRIAVHHTGPAPSESGRLIRGRDPFTDTAHGLFDGLR
jgi:hypothetical protein